MLFIMDIIHCMICNHPIDQFCKVKITRKILSRIKIYLAPHWSEIGYELIDEHLVDDIECSNDSNATKCFTMLKTWHSNDSNACYCKLFTALERYKHFKIIGEIKEQITS